VILLKAVKLINAYRMNNSANDYYKFKRAFGPCNERTSTYKELEKIGKDIPRPYDSRNPDTEMRIDRWFAAEKSAETAIKENGPMEFNGADLFNSRIVSMLNRMHITKKQTPLMQLRDRLETAIQGAWNVGKENLQGVRKQAKADREFDMAVISAAIGANQPGLLEIIK